MPMFWGDLLANTLHLSAEEAGAYLFLIAHAWEHQALVPRDRAQRIARISNFRWPKVRPQVQQFFNTSIDANNWLHERVKAELARAAELSNKRKDAALQMHSKSRASADANDPHTTTTTTIENLSNGKGREAAAVHVQVNYRDPGVDYRSPPRTKSDNVLEPLPLLAAKGKEEA